MGIRTVALGWMLGCCLVSFGQGTDEALARLNQGAQIAFQHLLPAMNIDGRHNGLYNNTELACPAILTTTSPELGEMMHKLRVNIYGDHRLIFIDNKTLTCTSNWIRDHIHQLKGCCHWEYDLTSFFQFLLDNQRADSCFFELIKQIDDRHWAMVDDDCRRFFPADNLALVRLELEADVEYLMVEGALQIYRVTEDDAWLKAALPKLEKGIEYDTHDPKRWDKEHGLMKRPFTIDTWDFAYTQPGTDRRVHLDKPMSIMHGDNSGLYQAMRQLAWMNRHFGNEAKAAEWDRRAEAIRANMVKYLWNGKFFLHQLHLGHPSADNLEAERLSLSNTYDMNRGVTTLAQSRAIIEEYMRRRKTTNAFAEWFSIDPAYPEFAGHPAGEYVNGGISPFTAGELAKSAFNSGYEKYGWDIITRFQKMIQRDGTVYFLYSPKDSKPLGGGPSAWGCAALLSAIDQGLAGVEDVQCGYRVIRFSPRFPVTPFRELRYFTGYEKTQKYVTFRYILTDKGMRYLVDSPAREIDAHLLLPDGKRAARVLVDGKETLFTVSAVGESSYADFTVKPNGRVNFEVLF